MNDEGVSNPSVGLASRTISAVHWRFAGATIAVGLRFGVGVLLARLLPPSDFGIVALAFVVIGFAQPLSDFGIASAVIQRPALTDRHVRVATTLSAALGLVITSTLVVAGPGLATLTGDRRVTPVLRALAVTFAIQGIAVPAGAMLRRRLEFKALFFIEIFSYLFGYAAVATALALAGRGVWSLVAAALIQSLLACIATLAIVRPPMRPLLALQEARQLLHFGIGSGANSWVNYFAVNGDNFVVGRMLGAAALGLYSRAYNLMNLPYTYAASVMSGVLFPAFAQIQRERARLGRAYLTMTQLTALIAAPSMCVLAIVAPDLVIGLYGDKWAGVVPPLQILCVAGYFRALYHVGGIVAQSVGRVYSELWRQVGYACLVIVGAFVGSRYGLQGVAVGVGIAIVCMFFATGQLALEIIEASWREYLNVQRAAILIATLTAAAAFVARLALQRAGAPLLITALGAIAAACVPWTVGAMWKLGSPELSALVPYLPRFARGLIEKRPGFQPNR